MGRNSKTDKAVFIEIRDDGIGIPESQSNGHGLRNMHYRATHAGVGLQIQDAEPGTRVRITVPLTVIYPQ